MNKPFVLEYSPEKDFVRFLRALKKQEDPEWNWLMRHFQKRVLPWIRKKDGRLPSTAIVSESYFIEEVFSSSLIRFYELFETGTFESLAQIRALMIKIADLKLKEGYRKVQRDKLIFLNPKEVREKGYKTSDDLEEKEQLQRTTFLKLNGELNKLPENDRVLLERYFAGDSFKSIAEGLNITEANCRKRKQRLTQRLRKLILIGLNIIWIGTTGI